MATFTNKIKQGENLSTIAKKAGLSPQEFADINPHLAGAGADSFQGLRNNVQIGEGYNLTPAQAAQPAPQVAPQEVPVEPTIEELGAPTIQPAQFSQIEVPQGAQESPELQAARQAQIDYLNSLKAPDENKTFEDTLSRFQAQIDAVNAQYANELAQARIAGRGRLGTRTAISGRRGLIGSDFGEAAFQGVQAQNLQEERMLADEKQARIQSILSQAKQDAADQVRARREEFVKGLDARLAYYSEADTRRRENANRAIQSLISQGVDPSEVDPTQLNQLARYYGINSDDIIAGYSAERQKFDEAEAQRQFEAQAQELERAKVFADIDASQADILKTQAEIRKIDEDIAKGKIIELSEGTLLYNRETGETFKNPKTYAPQRESSGSLLTPYQQFNATQSLAKDTERRTQNAREMTRQAEIITNSFNNIKAGSDRSLNTQAIIAGFNKILDPTSVVREGEYDRTAQGQSLLQRLEGKAQNIAAGGAGVTEETLEEAANIAQQYLEGAKQSIVQQNERAREFATQFGLNPDFVTSTSVPEVDQVPGVESLQEGEIITAPDGQLIQIID